jgi:hypothetical protein
LRPGELPVSAFVGIREQGEKSAPSESIARQIAGDVKGEDENGRESLRRRAISEQSVGLLKDVSRVVTHCRHAASPESGWRAVGYAAFDSGSDGGKVNAGKNDASESEENVNRK